MQTKTILLSLLAACVLTSPNLLAQTTPAEPPASPSVPVASPVQSPAATPPAARGAATGTRGSAQPNKWALALETDPADLKVFRDANAKLPPPAPGEDRVVFMGDSITANWQNSFAKLFPGKPYIGRGYTSETTQQMLIRFRPDVIALQPKVVVLLAGTNDIAGNTGRSTQEMIQDNITSMIDLAEFNHIKVVLLSVLPASDYWWQRGMEPAEKIVALNAWLKAYAAQRAGEVFFVDAHTPMSDEKHAMKPGLSGDGVHPNAAGYALISPLVETAIEKALAQK